MPIVIHPLTPDLLEDYLRFFDGVAFTDHPEWAWCYCTYYHLGKEDEERIDKEAKAQGNRTRETLRSIAIDLIQKGDLNGYLAYTDGLVVGWCNAADKQNYKKLCENRSIWEDGEPVSVKSVTCFIVAPQARRQGIAKALLARVVQDAKEEGYAFAEAYPATGELDCFGHYHGHPEMYEKNGFSRYKDLEGYAIYRKAL